MQLTRRLADYRFAHAESNEIHDCLLSALDEGRLSDPLGRTTTF